MTDPVRWLDDPNGAPNGAANLLNVAPAVPPLTAATKTALGARIAAAGATTALVSGAGTTALVAKVSAIVLAVGLVGGGIAIGVRRSRTAGDAPQPAPTTAHGVAPRLVANTGVEETLSPPGGFRRTPEPLAAAAIVPGAIVPGSTVVAATPSPAAGSALSGTRTPESADRCRGVHDRELAIVEAAQSALRANPRRSLELAAQHAREFPRECRLAHVGERENVAVQALMRLDRIPEARRRAQAFLRDPASRGRADTMSANAIRSLLARMP